LAAEDHGIGRCKFWSNRYPTIIIANINFFKKGLIASSLDIIRSVGIEGTAVFQQFQRVTQFGFQRRGMFTLKLNPFFDGADRICNFALFLFE